MNPLNTPQREAIHYLDGPLLVLAGAGSGKTRVITHKIAHLVQNCQIAARNIAAITFTNKAAREMQGRVSKILPSPAGRGLTVTTFHSLGLQILRQHADLLGYKPNFSILDSADSAKIISDILKTPDKADLRRIQSMLSNWKNARQSPEVLINAANNEAELSLARCYRAYQDTLFAYQALDFDDLIALPSQLFATHQDALQKWQHKLRYLLVDEYQDTNSCQYQLLKQLAGTKGQFTAVGDDDQSIYAWRGADIENIRGLQLDYPQLKVIKLEQNYRSSVRILRAANRVIGHNPKVFEKKLWSDLGLGDPLQVLACKDEEHEAEQIAMRLLAHKFEYRAKFLDYAVLYRSNHQARVLEKQLRQLKIPYEISGGQSFFDSSEIKDVLAYLRLLVNTEDDPAFIRAITTPKRGIGTQTLEKLGQYAAGRKISLFAAVFELGLEERLPPAQYESLQVFAKFINHMQYRAEKEAAGELLQELLKAIEFEAWLYDQEETRSAETKWNNIQDFCAWIAKKGEADEKNLLQLTQTIALITLLENNDESEKDAVRLSTLHAAKGLEYGHVYLIGCEEDILPHKQSTDAAQIEEERRLMYVGITRAQRSLTLSYALKRKRGGELCATEPSRFLEELSHEAGDDVKWLGKKGSVPTVTKSEGNARLANLKAMLQK